MGGFLGSEQIYMCFAESTPDQLERLGMESPLSLECNLIIEKTGLCDFHEDARRQGQPEGEDLILICLTLEGKP